MKLIIYLITILITGLILLQNMGGRYGSYAIISWGWLVISIAPVLIGIFQKREFTKRHIFYLALLVLIILAQPTFSLHPAFVLAYSLILIVPFIVFDFVKGNKLSEPQKFEVSDEVRDECKKLIAADKLGKCFNVLSLELKNEENKKALLILEQKWNQNIREKKMGSNTNEWLENQNSKIVNKLLNLLG